MDEARAAIDREVVSDYLPRAYLEVDHLFGRYQMPEETRTHLIQLFALSYLYQSKHDRTFEIKKILMVKK